MKKVTSVLPLVIALLASLSLVSLSGCSLRRPVAQHAVAYDRAVEDAHNQTALLNIVRSMKRHPQHYTAVTEVRGTASSSLTPSLSLTLRSGSLTPWTPDGSATRSDQALVTVSVLDDQEFVQGLLSPISLEQLDYFLKQGWPERLVGLLFVRRLDVVDDDFQHPYCVADALVREGSTTSYRNEPDDSDLDDPFKYIRCFGARLMHLRDNEHLAIEDHSTKSIDVELKTTDPDQLAELVMKADQAGMSIEVDAEDADSQAAKGDAEAPITYRLVKTKKSKILKWGGEDTRAEAYIHEANQAEAFERVGREKQKKDETPGPILFYFRSAQSVVYYLGQIMRAQELKGYSADMSFASMEPKIAAGGEVALLFVAWKKGRGDGNPLISVDYDGQTYVIPRFPNCDTGQVRGCHRSMQALAIVKQLIGLNKKHDNLSTTGVVTSIGG